VAGRSRRLVAGIVIAALGGVGVTVQSRVNAELSARLHDSVATAVISFGSGLVIVAALVVFTGSGRRGMHALAAALRAGRLRHWELIGGLSGAYFVVTQGAAAGPLGLAVYTIALIGGQVASSLAVDRAGIGPAGPQPVSANRLAGAALALVAVVVAVADRVGSPNALVLAALPALAGLFVAWQQAVNGRLEVVGGMLPATLVNFAVGTLALLAAFAVSLAVRGLPAALPAPLSRDGWLYTGGALGVVFIAMFVVVVRLTGVLVLGLAMIAGQVLGAVGIDLIAPSRTGGLTAYTVTGASLALLAVLVAARPPRPPQAFRR
jgi:bacterial/archaeal transporter family-2 protein